MRITAPFAAQQIKENLIHIEDGEQVGNWRDSNGGLGGGRIPYDVNTALAPAGLRAIAALTRAGFFRDHTEWATTADQYVVHIYLHGDILTTFQIRPNMGRQYPSLLQNHSSPGESTRARLQLREGCFRPSTH